MNAPEFALEERQSLHFGSKPYFADPVILLESFEKYTTEHPEFAKMIDELEVIYGTYRAEFNRLKDLATGFLRAADRNDFEHWTSISRQPWNSSILGHQSCPQDFYDVTRSVADKIRNSMYEQPPIIDPFFSRIAGHKWISEMFLEKTSLEVSRRFVGDSLLPHIIQDIIDSGFWNSPRLVWFWENQVSVSGLAKMKLLEAQQAMKLAILGQNSEDETQNPEQHPSKIVSVRPEILKQLLKDFVNRSILLLDGNYALVLGAIQKTRKNFTEIEGTPVFLMSEMLNYSLGLQFSVASKKPERGYWASTYNQLQVYFAQAYGIVRKNIQSRTAGILTSEIVEEGKLAFNVALTSVQAENVLQSVRGNV